MFPRDAARLLEETPAEMAAAWKVEEDAGRLLGRRRAAFEAWHGYSDENREAWRRVQRSIAILDALEPETLRALLPPSPASEAPEPRAFVRPPRRFEWLAVAAVLVAVVAIPTLLMTKSPGGGADGSAAVDTGLGPYRSFISRKGERRAIALRDGSRLTLDTDTEVLVDLTATRRSLKLRRGRALFEVAKDRDRPFVVEAGRHQVTALGTEFSVSLDHRATRVILAEGRVSIKPFASNAMTPAAAEATLKPGQSFVATGLDGGTVSAADLGSDMLWRQGMVSFQDISLRTAVAELNRYNERQIELHGDGTGALRVSGVFRTDSPDRFAGMVGELLPVKVRRNGGAIVIEAAASR
jgi:transmembrane sensor